jgi:hypothetical protein
MEDQLVSGPHFIRAAIVKNSPAIEYAATPFELKNRRPPMAQAAKTQHPQG